MDYIPIIAVVISLFFSLLIELFFQVVKYKDSINNKYPTQVTEYDHFMNPVYYSSVSKFISSGNRKWLSYFLFRLIPPFIILVLLSSVLSKYLDIRYVDCFIIFSASVSLILRDVISLYKVELISEKMIHFINIIFVLIVAKMISVISGVFDLSFLAPSIEGLIDNLWSSLFVALLVILYLKITNMNNTNEDAREKDLAISNYVLLSYSRINGKYETDIISACEKYNCSIPLLYAILIYENMNRPSWMRFIENVAVRFFKLELTVGIAQVKSKIPLDDRKSIYLAANILKNTKNIDLSKKNNEYHEAIGHYNVSKKYSASIFIVIENLKRYVYNLF